MINKLQLLKNQTNEEGFTLLELMVVIIIIGILAAIAIPIFANQQKAATDAAVKSDMKNISLAIQTYQSKTGHLPKDYAELADVGITVSEKSYYPGNNFLLCIASNGIGSYGLYARSLSGTSYVYASSTGKLDTTTVFPGSKDTLCPLVGVTPADAGSYGAWGKTNEVWDSWVKQ